MSFQHVLGYVDNWITVGPDDLDQDEHDKV